MKYLRVCIEHFDSLSGDEEVHLRHGLSFIFWSLKIENHTISDTKRESDRMKERQKEKELTRPRDAMKERASNFTSGIVNIWPDIQIIYTLSFIV